MFKGAPGTVPTFWAASHAWCLGMAGFLGVTRVKMPGTNTSPTYLSDVAGLHHSLSKACRHRPAGGVAGCA